MRTNVKQRSLQLQDYQGASVLGLAFMLAFACLVILQPVSADNFTDVFNTQSFRGSFEWFRHMDWLGTVVQAVISVFALLGTCLIVIRIMTSMLYLSARGLWEEVHDLKQSGGESEMYDLGFLNMAKSWAKGKAGTGLDAFLGAILMLLPDVKRYSDFGEKSGQKFEEDTSISQYMLKILLPTVLSVFFLAMAFNGTLVKGLAVTVDAMGTLADKAVSVNYSGFVEDLVNSKTGYKFIAASDGTGAGKFTQSVQTEVYGKVVSKIRGVNQNQLYLIGQNLETNMLTTDVLREAIAASSGIDPAVKEAFGNDNVEDYYWDLIDADIVVGGSKAERDGVLAFSMSELIGSEAMETLGGTTTGGEEVGSTQYVNIYFDQKKASTGGTMWTTDGET